MLNFTKSQTARTHSFVPDFLNLVAKMDNSSEKMSRLEHSIMLKNIADNLKHLRVMDEQGNEVVPGSDWNPVCIISYIIPFHFHLACISLTFVLD